MTKIFTIDAATGEEILRDMTSNEEADYLKIKSDADEVQAQKDEAEIDKAALLAKLGITADEAKLLLS